MIRYTFEIGALAHTISRNAFVTIPDQVAESQKEYDGKSFPVLRRDGSKARATLRGDEYGLWTPGTGDPVVSIC
ncbi:MAG TPA: hypothetical protein PKE15_00010 [Ottowia sp.]|nr:hypothetical protein [Ottowia sp.]